MASVEMEAWPSVKDALKAAQGMVAVEGKCRVVYPTSKGFLIRSIDEALPLQRHYRVWPSGDIALCERDGTVLMRLDGWAARCWTKGKGESMGSTGFAKGSQALAQRWINAEEKFITFAMDTAGLTREQALTALRAYKEAKVIVIDKVGGQYTFRHSAFADPDVLRKAAR